MSLLAKSENLRSLNRSLKLTLMVCNNAKSDLDTTCKHKRGCDGENKNASLSRSWSVRLALRVVMARRAKLPPLFRAQIWSLVSSIWYLVSGLPRLLPFGAHSPSIYMHNAKMAEKIRPESTSLRILRFLIFNACQGVGG